MHRNAELPRDHLVARAFGQKFGDLLLALAETDAVGIVVLPPFALDRDTRPPPALQPRGSEPGSRVSITTWPGVPRSAPIRTTGVLDAKSPGGPIGDDHRGAVVGLVELGTGQEQDAKRLLERGVVQLEPDPEPEGCRELRDAAARR